MVGKLAKDVAKAAFNKAARPFVEHAGADRAKLAEMDEKIAENRRAKDEAATAAERLRARAQLGGLMVRRSKFGRGLAGTATTGRAIGRGAAAAGRGAAAAGKAADRAGAAINRAGSAAGNVIVNTGNAAGRMGIGMRSSFAFFLYVVMVHALDVFIDFNRKNNWMFAAYLVAALIAYFSIFKSQNQAGWQGFRPKACVLAVGLSTAAFFITWLAGLLGNIFPTSVWIRYMVLFFPIWPMFMLLVNPQGSPGIQRMAAVWMTFWILFAVFVFLTSMKGPADYGLTHGPIDMKGTLTDFKDQVVETSKRIWRGIFGITPKIIDLYNRTKYEQLYIGTVEDNKGLPLGIYVKSFGASSSTRFFVNQSIYFTALVQGASFLEDPPTLESHCYYQPFDGPPIYVDNADDVTPHEKEILFMEPFYVDCFFDGKFFPKEDTYTVTYRGMYDFNTWAYATWIFVDQNTRMSYIRQGLDINEELGIPQQIETFYTNGPANIGMSLLQLPISIDRTKADDSGGLKSSIKFIVSISNKETNTEIVRVDSFAVLVPKSIKFRQCSADITLFETTDEYNKYYFKLRDEVREYHRSISCWLDITDVDELLGEGPVSYKTFVVDTNYLVQVEQAATIRVEASP